MIKGLWNIGIKTENLDAEVEFLRRVGAEVVLRERLDAGEGTSLEYAILRLGGVRMLLFPKTIFEDRIEGGVRPGLTHAVYEVDDLETEYRRIKALGARVLVEPREISAGFGRRKLAFFRSPGGLAFEVMQILEDRLS
jgi:catechol 2,3-dioxygenase-like lactoylglutathione lyase family enzyme